MPEQGHQCDDDDDQDDAGHSCIDILLITLQIQSGDWIASLAIRVVYGRFQTLPDDGSGAAR